MQEYNSSPPIDGLCDGSWTCPVTPILLLPYDKALYEGGVSSLDTHIRKRLPLDRFIAYKHWLLLIRELNEFSDCFAMDLDWEKTFYVKLTVCDVVERHDSFNTAFNEIVPRCLALDIFHADDVNAYFFDCN
jgi:hypothetical protein